VPATLLRSRANYYAPRYSLHTGAYRIRHDRIDSNGKLALRHNSRLHHIGMGRRHAGTNVLVLIHDLHIRVVTTHGQLLRELRLDPTKNLCTMSRDIAMEPQWSRLGESNPRPIHYE
jgi:hypothetical protein